MEDEFDRVNAWERFTRTGSVGAYLVYRAIQKKLNGKK